MPWTIQRPVARAGNPPAEGNKTVRCPMFQFGGQAQTVPISRAHLTSFSRPGHCQTCPSRSECDPPQVNSGGH